MKEFIAGEHHPLNNLKNRWIETLRSKACKYEHPELNANKEVLSPSLDDICNEMEAFFTGLNS